MATDSTKTSNGKNSASKNVVDETWNTDSDEGRKLPENAHDFELSESNGSADGHLANAHMGLGLLADTPIIEAIKTSEFPTAARRPAYSVLDDSATRSLLGDQTAPWRENLKRMLGEVKALG